MCTILCFVTLQPPLSRRIKVDFAAIAAISASQLAANDSFAAAAISQRTSRIGDNGYKLKFQRDQILPMV